MGPVPVGDVGVGDGCLVCDHSRTLNSWLPTRIDRIMRRAKAQLDAGHGQFLENVAGIGQRQREPVELG